MLILCCDRRKIGHPEELGTLVPSALANAERLLKINGRVNRRGNGVDIQSAIIQM